MKKIIKKNNKADLNKVSGGVSFKRAFKKYGPKLGAAIAGIVGAVALKKAGDKAILKGLEKLLPGNNKKKY